MSFIPSRDIITASIFISEASVDMSRFPSTSHLASWIELWLGNNENTGKKRSTGIRHGYFYLKKYLYQTAYATRNYTRSLLAE
ncbi:TPA: transposase [Streptococcus equi subsp. zooepidemicus]|nr:transposase [Streptococcus equi subsp. zooepidemicus]